MENVGLTSWCIAETKKARLDSSAAESSYGDDEEMEGRH